MLQEINPNLINVRDVFCENGQYPQLTLIVSDKQLGVLGYLVVDSLADGKCSGGIRMAHDITLGEVAGLARAMTLKYAFSGLYVGGAKAGIVCPLGASDGQKREILTAFGRNLGPVMRSFYAPGGDIGVGADEVDVVKQGAGIVPSHPPAKYRAGFFTAYGVFVSAQAALRQLGLELKGCSFALEGFGGVGQSLAKMLHAANARITAISTMEGGIVNKNGLDVAELVTLAKQYGDDVVHHYPDADKIDKADLFGLDVNVIVPGARAWSITAENANSLKANLVVPSANIPVTKDASAMLYERGVKYIPDFVTNWGGIVGCGLLNRGYDEREVLSLLDKIVGAKVERIMQLSKQEYLSTEEIAERIANYNYEQLRRNVYLKKNKKWRWIVKKLKDEKSLMPMIERTAWVLHDKMNARRHLAKRLLRPLAIANIHRRHQDALSEIDLLFTANT